jgi:hypothetical protein
MKSIFVQMQQTEEGKYKMYDLRVKSAPRRKRKHPGELRKIGSPFVVLRRKLMKMDGPQHDVKSQDDGVKLVAYIGLITFKDYYTCASTSLN